MAVTFCLGAVFVLPLLFFYDLSWLKQPGGGLAVLHLGLVSAALGYLLFGRGFSPSWTGRQSRHAAEVDMRHELVIDQLGQFVHIAIAQGFVGFDDVQGLIGDALDESLGCFIGRPNHSRGKPCARTSDAEHLSAGE
jgi:hypothetical protein